MSTLVSTRRMVTLTNSKSPDFVWRWEVMAESDDMARFLFIQRWAGMILSHDVRPSELQVEEVAESAPDRTIPRDEEGPLYMRLDSGR